MRRWTARCARVVCGALAWLSVHCGDPTIAVTQADVGPDLDAAVDVASDADADSGANSTFRIWCDTVGVPGECTCVEDTGEPFPNDSLAGRFCCARDSDTPYACLFSAGRSEIVFEWVDMSQFGSVCGGRDFPYQNALPACPWDEETP